MAALVPRRLRLRLFRHVCQCMDFLAKYSKGEKYVDTRYWELPKSALRIWNKENLLLYGRRLRKNSKIKWQSEEDILSSHCPLYVTLDEKLYFVESTFNQNCSVDCQSTEDEVMHQIVNVNIEGHDNRQYTKDVRVYDKLQNGQSRPISSRNRDESSNQDNLINGDLSDILAFPLFAKNVHMCHQVAFTNLESVLTNSKIPGVSKVLSETMPPENRYFLLKWEEKMIAELGYEGFIKFKKDTFAKGIKFHQCVQKRLEGMTEDGIEVNDANAGHWNSIKSVFKDISDVHLVEKPVVHPYLGYKGIFDCIATFRDTVCIIDWKTSKKTKSDIRFTYDNPLQLAAYLGALLWDKNYHVKVENAVIVVAYEDGKPADVHLMQGYQCEEYWNAWLQRLYQYRLREMRKVPNRRVE